MGALAIIPARSGSKGLKDKNIKTFCGRPLMYYTIQAALETGMFESVMVSTDSESYCRIANECGAEVPFLRSNEKASDTADTWDAVREVIKEYKGIGREFDTICLLQPTSPLREKKHIEEAMNLYNEKNANAVVSLCKMQHSISICNQLPEGGSLKGFYDSTRTKRRQDESPYYQINGAIYIQRVEELMEKKNLYSENCYAYLMDKASSYDIDDEIDFIAAEAIMKSMASK